MTALRDPFDVVHKKDIKNKEGAVVAQVDYVGWSQSADRLDESPEVARWSFEVRNIGQDWAHGRLTIVGPDGAERAYENIGYAENAEMAWKKEPLKDAVSDAFKRCAALAGVARYLYDKDAPTNGRSSASSPASRPVSTPRPANPPASAAPVGGLPEEPPELAAMFDHRTDVQRDAVATNDGFCPDHGVAWVLRPGGVSKAGKPYDPFWACPSPERPYCTKKPSRAFLAAQER